jgi:outer membrane receptor protein involved in Fe transport
MPVRFRGRSHILPVAGSSRLALAAGLAILAGGTAFAQEAGTQAPEGPLVSEPAAADADPADTEQREIVVTGSRIARQGFTAPTPLTVIGQDAIQAQGDTNIAEVLAEFPAFRPGQAPENSFVTITGNIGARTLDLRGLEPQRTLVLVNGRRFIPSSPQGTVDLNLIPTMLIQRAEIVTGGASAAYGSDAVAGVVNLILDTDLEGIRAQAQYGISERGDDANYQFGLAGGTGFAGGRGHVIAGFEYSENKGMGGCYQIDWCGQEYSNFSNGDWIAPTPANPDPGNPLPNRVTLPHKHPTLITPGLINSPGAGGNPLLRGTYFLADGTPVINGWDYGMWPSTFAMVGGDGHHQDPFTSAHLMKSPVRRWSAYMHGKYDLTDGIRVFAELSYGNVVGWQNGAQFREIGLAIRRDNPFLPAEVLALMGPNQASISLARDGDDFGVARFRGENETFRGVAGVEGELGGSWTWNAYYQYGHNRYDQEMANNRNNARFAESVDAVRNAQGQAVCRINADANPNNDNAACVPVNLFGEYQWDPAAKAYFYGTGWQTATIDQHVAAANIQGQLFDTWAGPVSVAAGLEYREDSIVGNADPVSLANGWYVGNGSAVSGSVDVREAYLETVVPLADGLPGAHNLELNGAIRLTDYSTSGQVTTWKVGGIWEPVEGLRLRGTRSRDIRAPNLLELFGSTTSASSRVVTGGIQYLPRVFTGGNDQLSPETADTWTAGVVLMPRWGFLDGLRVSADYYDIEIDGAISQVGAQTIVDRCALADVQEFCSLITFGTANPNEIVEVRNPWLNLNTLIVRGIDLEADYRLRLDEAKTLNFRILASYVKDLITVDSVGSIDRAGQTGVQTGALPGLPRWTVNGTVTYDSGPFSMNVQARYIAAGMMDATLIGPTDPGYDTDLPNSISDNHIEAMVYVDMGASYTFDLGGSRSLQLFAVVKNLTDPTPPVNVYSGSGTNPFLFDIVGRRFTFGARVAL